MTLDFYRQQESKLTHLKLALNEAKRECFLEGEEKSVVCTQLSPNFSVIKDFFFQTAELWRKWKKSIFEAKKLCKFSSAKKSHLLLWIEFSFMHTQKRHVCELEKCIFFFVKKRELYHRVIVK